MELVQVRPLRTDFGHLVDFPAGNHVFVHQAANLSECNVAQLSSDPSVRLFRQVELNVIRDIPVAERVPVRRKSIWIGQRRHRILPSTVRVLLLLIDILGGGVDVCQLMKNYPGQGDDGVHQTAFDEALAAIAFDGLVARDRLGDAVGHDEAGRAARGQVPEEVLNLGLVQSEGDKNWQWCQRTQRELARISARFGSFRTKVAD